MSAGHKTDRIVRDLIASYGGRDILLTKNKHCKFHFTTPSGERRMLVAPGSPSDGRRGLRNLETVLRKLIA
jgi:hypothetical protein